MDLFEQATKVAKEVGSSVVDSAKNIGNTIYSSTKEQSEIANLKIQKSSLSKKLQDSYAEIGKRYVKFTKTAEAGELFDASDLLQAMQADLDKMSEIDAAIEEKNLTAKKDEEEKLQRKAEDEYLAAKEKLDKALAMDIITKDEYDEKMIPIQKKFDNHVQLRKYDMQLQMGIITAEEYDQKVADLLR